MEQFHVRDRTKRNAIRYWGILQKGIGNLFLFVCTLIWIFPFYWGVVNSFKTEQAMFEIPPQFFPKQFTWHNYVELFNRTLIFRWFVNSVVVSFITMLLVCVISSMAGYAFSKLRFRGRDQIFYFIISLMMLPHYILLVPLFRLMKSLGWFDSYLGLILPGLAVPFGVFLMKQFIQTIPSEIMEAARIDGCNEFLIFTKIVVPMALPAIGSLAIFEFVKSWNDYVWQLIVISSDEMKTLPLGVAGLKQETVIQYGQILAGATLSALPIIVIFIAFQKFFTKGITLGAVKG